MSEHDLRPIVLANDVRGVAGETLDEGVARAFGAAFADSLEAKDLILGHDMRLSSPQLARAFAEGAVRRGATVGLAGLSATDQLYCASGLYRAAGAMITASHNPGRDNGIKLCLPGARPISRGTGLDDLRVRAEQLLDEGEISEIPGGRLQELDTLEDYVATVLKLAPVPSTRRLKVVVDAGSGMAGLTMPAVAAQLPSVEMIGLHLELDGTFPHHPADPTDPANLTDLSARVREERADLGLAFDGDADRCTVVDETGAPVPPSAITALIAEREIARARAAGEERPAVVANVVSSRHVAEAVEAAGGRFVVTPVGHSLIKAIMEREDAVLGGEHSAHYYFRDFFRADSGMLAALHVLAALAESTERMSALVAGHTPYAASGEINRRPADAAATREAVREAFAPREGVAVDELDGLTVRHWGASGDQWWFSLRSSNTQQALRLNVEAADEGTMQAVRDEVLGMIGADADEVRVPAQGGSHGIATEDTVHQDQVHHQDQDLEHDQDQNAASGGTGFDGPAWLRRVLRCPQCGAELVDARGEDGASRVLRCTDQGHEYRIRGGIPVLIAGRD
jgi:phosphomannomutase